MAQNEFDYSLFRDEIITSTEGLSPEQFMQFAWRCGVRALPFLAAEYGDFSFWEKEKRTDFILRLFWALDISVAAVVAVDADATEAATNAAKAADAAAYVAESASYAADAITNAADAANYATGISAAISAARAAKAAELLGLSLKEIIRKDLQQMIMGEGAPVSTDVYGVVWPQFLRALEKEGCAYWGQLVQGWFESGLQIDQEALKRRLSVPAEIREKGAVEVAKYLQELEKGSKRLNEARIIILGDKGAGKTSIARKLVNPEASLPKPEESTPGVDTTSWELDQHAFNVRIWDFAGHTVTHAVHQFFLSERCLYILVCNGRNEEYNRLEYWLSQMQIYGGHSEVIILVNKKDKHDHSVPINKLKRKYPIIKLSEFSLLHDQEKIETFRADVLDYVINHPSWEKQEIPETYYNVKEKLESLFVVGDLEKGEERIDRSVFDEIADDFEVKDKEALLRDLHALGISLWYEDIEEVQTLVLNPEWISHGIYTIINWVHGQKQHGLSLKQFEEVFREQKKRYPKKEHEFLFKLMKHYQLAFETKKGNARYLIIPHLLEEDQPDPGLIPHFEVGESLMLRYKSEVDLPSHTISRFIVRHHEEIKLDRRKALVWREGVILEDSNGNLALIVEDNRTISVSVKGHTKTQFLDQLRETLNDLFKEFKKQKPELQYRVQRFGELPGDSYTSYKRNEIEDQMPLWMNDRRILSLANQNKPHADDLTGNDIHLHQTVNNYDIKEGNLIQGHLTGDLVRGNKNTFNFENCNLNLQGGLKELQDKLSDQGDHENAGELQQIEEAVRAIEEIKEPQQVKKEFQRNGILRRMDRFMEEANDEASNLHGVIKKVGKGISTVQDIAQSYNDIAQWCGLPQVPKPFLKK